MGQAFFWGFVSVMIILGLTFWVTKKAYSRKWDEGDD